MALVYYISHPQVIIDADKPVPHWSLSPVGVQRLGDVAGKAWVRTIGTFVSSNETKALETARHLMAGRTDATLIVREDAHENDRSSTGFVPPERFEDIANAFFAKPDESVLGWEKARDAQTRVVDMADSVLAQLNPTQPLAFVGHGGIGTLLLCALRGDPIARIHDQPGGGGNVFAYDSASRHVHHGWQAIEHITEDLK